MFVAIICLVSALSLAVTSAFTFWKVVNWYDFYRPIIMFIAGYLLGVAIAWIFYDICGRIMSSYKKKYDKPSNFARFLLANGMYFIWHHGRARVKRVGLEKLPNEPFLLVSNHKSNFDPMITSSIIGKRHIAFITKRDNMKIPLAGHLMWRNCYMPVDREDKLQSLEQFKRATDLIASGATSVGIYPEGTRQKPDVVLGEFHNGAFNIAIRTGCPIAIITVRGTESIHKNFPFKGTKITVKCVQVLYKEDYASMNATDLSNYIHGIMLNDLQSAQ